jgi:hypothetical protein
LAARSVVATALDGEVRELTRRRGPDPFTDPSTPSEVVAAVRRRLHAFVTGTPNPVDDERQRPDHPWHLRNLAVRSG